MMGVYCKASVGDGCGWMDGQVKMDVNDQLMKLFSVSYNNVTLFTVHFSL